MSIREIEQRDPSEVTQATLLIVLRNNGQEMLLAMKKRGFATGKWNAPGGKQHPGEDIKETAARETEEEVKIKTSHLIKVAVLRFGFPKDPDKIGWNQDVHVFIANKWTGEAIETEEMRPEWYRVNEIPYSEMWEDDILWLPRVLTGEKLKAVFIFGEDNKMKSYKIQKVNNL